MICPQCCGFDEAFNEKLAKRELKRYHRKGPPKVTALLIDAIKSRDPAGAALLDVGGGIGVIQHELIKAGVDHSVDVDGSKTYIEIAQREADRQGHGERVSFQYGDFVDIADDVAAADIVTLDRVICCYPDMPTLVTRSLSCAKRLYGLSYPRRNVLLRLARPVINTILRLRRCPLRFYLHDPAEVDRLVRQAGFTAVTTSATPLWNVALYERNGV